MFPVDHDCEINFRQDEILFIPGKGPFRKVLGALRRFCMASQKNPNAKKYLRSLAAIIYEKRRQLRTYKRVIHPFSLFRHWWDFIMIVAMSGGSLVFPYQAAFDMYREARGWTVIKNLVLLLCCADIVVNFMTGFYDKTQRVVQLEQNQIALRYIRRGTFVPDVIGSLPTDMFLIGHWNRLIVAREVLSLLCIFRTASLYSYITKKARSYDVSRVSYETCHLIFWALLTLHWQACLHYIVPVAVASLAEPLEPDKDSWIMQAELWDIKKRDKFFYSLLRAIATFTRSGYGGTVPRTIEDQYLTLIFHILGALVFCSLVAHMMQVFRGTNSSRFKYHAMTAQLKQYMRQKQLSSATQRRFLAYYEFRFQFRYFREVEVLNTLSSQIRQEIGMLSCRKLVENVTFFNNLPVSLLVRIVAILSSEIFLTNDVIVRANQPGDCMYFIATGTVAIYTSSGKEVCHLEDGAHFGEIALVMPDERRVASVIAVEVCELYRLERADFSRTIHPYPMLWERIKKIAMERNERTTILNSQQ